MSQSAISARSSNRPISPELPEQVERSLEGHTRRTEEAWRGTVHFRKTRAPAGGIELDSNDYLRLAHHPDVVRAKVECLERRGGALLMSSLFIGEDAVHHEFERLMAQHLGCEATILCQSGYTANLGLLQSIAGPDTPVYVDRIAHMSLWDGIHQARATAYPFRHNDVDHLENRIRRFGRGVVVVDSIYSTDGSVCPLTDLVAVARRHGCTLVVDESHSLGTHGPRGEGLVCELGLESEVAFRTASLSKAFCERGGLLACPGRFSEFFRGHSHPAVFSSAVMSYQVAGFIETLRLIREEGWRRERLRRNAELLRSGLDALGYNVDASRSQIVSLEPGSEYRTLFFRDLLAARGVMAAPFLHPATERNRGLVRMTTHCDLLPEEIDRVIEVCAEVRSGVEMESWSSTRRKHARTRTGMGLVITRGDEAARREDAALVEVQS